MAGKPYRPIYEAAQRALNAAAGKVSPKSSILAIGDSVRTDAVGAAGFGVDLLFITGAVHAGDLGEGAADPQAVADLLAPVGGHVRGFMPALRW
jgi:ribonucleotide monophosphatase NagD (HAD superfamily)